MLSRGGRIQLTVVGLALIVWGGCRTAQPTSDARAPSTRGAQAAAANKGRMSVQQMGPLSFDPLGADFAEWVNGFKNAVYKNWVVPPATIEGFRGHVDLEFTVERDGTVGSLRVLKQSGRTAVDLVSQRSLLASAPFLPLPAAFPDPRITMQVSFRHNENR